MQAEHFKSVVPVISSNVDALVTVFSRYSIDLITTLLLLKSVADMIRKILGFAASSIEEGDIVDLVVVYVEFLILNLTEGVRRDSKYQWDSGRIEFVPSGFSHKNFLLGTVHFKSII